MSYSVTLGDCESTIFDYFNSISNAIDLYVNETYDGIFSESALDVIDQLKSKMNHCIKNIKLANVGSGLELLVSLVDPLYIVTYDNDVYELLEITKLYFYTQIIKRNETTHRYFTSSMYGIDTHIKQFIFDCCEISIAEIYKFFLDRNLPLIENPNEFIKVCEGKDICALFNEIIHKQRIDYNILVGRNSKYLMSDLYKLLKKNMINIDSSLINKMIIRCREEDIFELYKLLIFHNEKNININNIIFRFETCSIPILLKLISTDINIDLKTVDFNLLIKNCDSDQIVQLYQVILNNENIHKFIFSNISFAMRIINNMFSRCIIDHIEDLYRLIDMKEIVDANMILSGCDRLDIIQLYNIIPNKQDIDINKLFNRCDRFEMILLYKLVPNKKSIDVNNILNRCNITDLIQFYNLIENKKDVDTEILFDRCNDTDVLELYKLVVANSDRDIDINKLINICSPSDILELIKLTLNKQKIDIVNTFNKCKTSDAIFLYDELKYHKDIDLHINHIISRCYPSDIFYLYERILNKDVVDVIGLIERSNGNYILELYKLIPKEKKSDVDVNIMFELCDSNDTLRLYKLIEDKHDININNLLDRCPRNEILPLFKIIANRENLDINKVIDRCDYFDMLELYQQILLDDKLVTQVNLNNLISRSHSSDILNLYRLIPNKQHIDVNAMIWQCSNSDVLELYSTICASRKMIASQTSLYKLIPNKQDINIDNLLIKCSEYNRSELNKFL